MILIQSFDENNWMIEKNFAGTIKAVKIKHRWFSCSIVACHAIDPISIPVWCKAEKQKHFSRKAQFYVFSIFYFATVKKEEAYSNN